MDMADIKQPDDGETPWNQGILCIVELIPRITTWSTKTVTDFSTLSAIDSGTGTYRTRSYSGVNFLFASSGKFAETAPSQLVTSLVNGVVLYVECNGQLKSDSCPDSKCTALKSPT